MPELAAGVRRHSFGEVNCGYSEDLARMEATRCLFCKKPLCVQGCPVAIDIPAFIKEIDKNNLRGAYEILRASNPLPAICGRVCPQEVQCEVKCVVGKKGDPVAIGYLERFVGDWAIGQSLQKASASKVVSPSGKRAAIIGSGPAGIACAQDLARAGVDVVVFEALHEPGGVLNYGIPPFRLPKAIIAAELEGLNQLGVRIECNKIIGRLFTIDQLMRERGFHAVFIGTGAGLPKFMGLPGESLNGVMSANEFLTRVNLMRGFQKDDTPVGMGQKVVVIGAGNTALDAARTALRLEAKNVSIVYRRSRQESPGRVEELRHAEEEGIYFQWLTNPVRFFGNAQGAVREMECIRMELGEPDAGGRRSPRPLPGSEFRIEVDTVIYALGTVSNPIISRSTPDLKINKYGYIDVDPATQMTSIPGVFAGGDIVTGAATVILALGAGRRAAKGIIEYLGLVHSESKPDSGKEEVHGLAMSKVSSDR